MSIALAMILALAGPSAADLEDAKCAAAMNALSEKVTDAEQKTGATGAMMYYLGRIAGRSGQAALKPALDAATPLIDAAALPTLAGTCASAVQGAVGGL